MPDPAADMLRALQSLLEARSTAINHKRRGTQIEGPCVQVKVWIICQLPVPHAGAIASCKCSAECPRA